MTQDNKFSIPDRLQSPLEQRLKSWESLLMLVAITIFIANSFASPYFLNAWNLSDATFNFTEKASTEAKKIQQKMSSILLEI